MTSGGKSAVRLGSALFFLVSLATGAMAQVPRDGFWNIQGRAIPGMRCGDWMVRLAVEQGRLTGLVGVGQGNVMLQNLVLRPDGSFSGNTAAGHVNARAVRAYQVRGRFSGDLVTVTLSNEICPDRQGHAQRQWVGY
ncbi:MAG TPA: hypothetical protein VG651_05170 [Stellaceae bacterium]|nr:hypothetical protein [Stellaceae bacterium]